MALTWKLEWKIQRCKHDGEENPESARAGNEKASAWCLLQLARSWYVAICDLPVRASNQAECEHKWEEEDEEYDICAQRQDEIKKAKQAHDKQKEGKAGREARTLETSDRLLWICGIRSPGIKGRFKGTSETKPEGTWR